METGYMLKARAPIQTQILMHQALAPTVMNMISGMKLLASMLVVLSLLMTPGCAVDQAKEVDRYLQITEQATTRPAGFLPAWWWPAR